MHFLNIIISLLAATSAVVALPSAAEATSELEILRRTIESLERRLSNVERTANIERRDTNVFAAIERRMADYEAGMASMERRASDCCGGGIVACNSACKATYDICVLQGKSTCTSALNTCQAKCG
ncbi:hypothetical protein TWF694_008106 [Orbilia ellipsospora]|uniref:Uncharacterized protein n=1 Tax=Orbilia ellipsospora TaxID=2528407 RepID=A0AAV9XF33_9PEZI